jgi:DNA-binding beta-propeller fold protein YncE
VIPLGQSNRKSRTIQTKIVISFSLLSLITMISFGNIVSNVYAAEPQFNNPYGDTVNSSGNVYVADANNNRIQKFSSTGTFIRKWGSLGTGNGQFNSPIGIAVDSSGYVYVDDTSNNRIQKFSNTGTFIRKWGAPGSLSLTPDGQILDPFS